MIVYNVTFSVDKGVSEEFLSWLKDTHIPEVIEAGLFESCKVLKVLSHDDEATFSFAVQFYAKSIGKVHEYASQYESHHHDRFGERVLSYPTLLTEV